MLLPIGLALARVNHTALLKITCGSGTDRTRPIQVIHLENIVEVPITFSAGYRPLRGM